MDKKDFPLMWYDDVLNKRIRLPKHKSYDVFFVFQYLKEHAKKICSFRPNEFLKASKELPPLKIGSKGVIPASDIIDILVNDDVLSSMTFSYFSIQENCNKFNRYYVSRNLSKIFDSCTLDIKSDHLFQEFFGYFEFNYDVIDKDKSSLMGMYVTITKDPEDIIYGFEYSLRITGITASDVVHGKETYFNGVKSQIGLKPNLSIKDLIDKLGYARSKYTAIHNEPSIDKEIEPASYEPYIHMAVCAVAYIIGGNHELNDIIKSATDENAKSMFHSEGVTSNTPKPYVFLGRGFNNKYTNELTVVTGHWKSQPHGPMNSLRKLIFRDDYIANLRTKLD